MTKDRIIDKVEQLKLIHPSWEAWRIAREEFGYRKTYHAYLSTDEWRSFRDRVKALYPTCQCCLISEASEVHHLDYRYSFFENAGMVQAVCRPCHEAMTGIDNWEKRNGRRISG